MNDLQKEVCSGLRYLAQRVEDGAYGKGDDAFCGPTGEDAIGLAFLEDLHDHVIDIIV